MRTLSKYLYLYPQNKPFTKIITENINEIIQFNRNYLNYKTNKNGIFLQHINFIFPDKIYYCLNNTNLIDNKLLFLIDNNSELNFIISNFTTQMEDDISNIIHSLQSNDMNEIKTMNEKINLLLFNKTFDFILKYNKTLKLSNLIFNDTYEKVGILDIDIKLTVQR
jgi:hypothetical protein